jgi:hypothetical protein
VKSLTNPYYGKPYCLGLFTTHNREFRTVFGDNSTKKPRQFLHLVTNVASNQRNKIIATVNNHPRVHDAGWMVCGQETLLHPIFVWYLTTVAYFLPTYIVITCISCVCVYMIFYPFMKAGNCLGSKREKIRRFTR